METNRVSQLDETGSGYIFLNNILLLKPLSADSKGKGTGYVRLHYRNKTIEKLNVLE
jgi:hypothetical protein